jgi:hypothetical protein
MQNIYTPDNNFDFSNLTLTHPQPITRQNGSYFTKILNNNKSLYIETPKCLTKQCIIKSNKKYFCDLMFSINDEEFIQWFEKLESTCQSLLFKSSTWFDTKLSEEDIDNVFQSPLKIYKSGKFYLVKSNIKTDYNGNPSVNIYDENEYPLSIDSIKTDTHIVSILEIQGIKFSTKSFIIEIELKQIMVVNTDNLFSNCLIKSKRGGNSSNNNTFEKNDNTHENDDDDDNNNSQEKQDNDEKNDDEKQNDEPQEKDDKKISFKLESVDIIDKNNDEDISVKETETETETETKENNDDLEEVNIEWDNLEETVGIKKPKELYDELYNNLLEKIKDLENELTIAKNEVDKIENKLSIAKKEAENIKNTYII